MSSTIRCVSNSPMRLPVQWVNRPNLDFRGFCGGLASGVVRPGDRIRAVPSGRESRVARIVTAAGDQPMAVAGQSITLTLEDEIDISRGGPDRSSRRARGRRSVPGNHHLDVR